MEFLQAISLADDYKLRGSCSEVRGDTSEEEPVDDAAWH
jgi:hypothetical protein